MQQEEIAHTWAAQIDAGIDAFLSDEQDKNEEASSIVKTPSIVGITLILINLEIEYLV